jgi:membrane-associated protease RseP (regulator of RpoE activity)
MKPNRKHLSLLLLIALCLAPIGAPAFAGSDPEGADGDDKIFERRVVVRDGEDPEVIFWSSDDGQGPRRIPFPAMLMGRGYIGVQLTDLGPELRRHFGIDSESGVIIAKVEKDSPAEKAGLQVGDVIVEIDQQVVHHAGDLARAVRAKKDGETVRVEVLRDGRMQAHDIAVAERGRGLIGFERLPDKMMVEGMVHPAMERAFRVMDDPAFKERVKAVRDRERALEERMKELEQRLIEMEKKLRENR